MSNLSDPNQFLKRQQQNGTASLLPALLPSAELTYFPVPTLVVSPDGSQVAESLLLAGVRMPGQWLLTADCMRHFGWEERKGWGLTGATLVPVGDPLVPVHFDVKIWNNRDAWIYRQLLKTILKKPAFALPGTTSFAGMSINQPQVNDIAVVNVVIDAVSPLINPLVTSGGRGPWTARCNLREYRQPIAAIKTPVTNYSDPGTPQPSAKDNLDTEIQLAGKAASQAAADFAKALSGGPKP